MNILFDIQYTDAAVVYILEDLNRMRNIPKHYNSDVMNNLVVRIYLYLSLMYCYNTGK